MMYASKRPLQTAIADYCAPKLAFGWHTAAQPLYTTTNINIPTAITGYYLL